MDKYYIALNSQGHIVMIYTDNDIEFFAEKENGNRNPFELFSGELEQDIIDKIYVCSLTSKGLVYKKELNRQLEEVSL